MNPVKTAGRSKDPSQLHADIEKPRPSFWEPVSQYLEKLERVEN